VVWIERPAIVTNPLADDATIAQALGGGLPVVTILAKRPDRLEQKSIDVIGTTGAPAFDVIHAGCRRDCSGAQALGAKWELLQLQRAPRCHAVVS
jgi:hypothetical protein